LTVSEKYKNRWYKSFKKADARQQDTKKIQQGRKYIVNITDQYVLKIRGNRENITDIRHVHVLSCVSVFYTAQPWIQSVSMLIL
jgi:isochorismate hydrolase